VVDVLRIRHYGALLGICRRNWEVGRVLAEALAGLKCARLES
jgi:hypothetical protein